ncbi:hypothetical protein [Chitinophaga skermanii]|nr:hypothetical protein [Chitinophaga skermanii]
MKIFLSQYYLPTVDIVHILETRVEPNRNYTPGGYKLYPNIFKKLLPPIGVICFLLFSGNEAFFSSTARGGGDALVYLALLAAVGYIGVILFRPGNPIIVDEKGINMDGDMVLWENVEEIFFVYREWRSTANIKYRHNESFLVLQTPTSLIYFAPSVSEKQLFSAIVHYNPKYGIME